MTKRLVSIDTRGDRLLVSTNWESGGLFLQGDWIEAVNEPVSDEELGKLVRSALEACRGGVPYPDPDVKRRRGMLLKIAGVRSESQFARGTYHVTVHWDDAQPVMTLEPYRSDGRGFVGVRGREITLATAASDAALGAAIRGALAIAAGGA